MKTLKQLLEDIQTGYAPKEISYKGYTTKNLHHVPDATKAFQATITRVEKGTLEDNGEVLDSLKNTDTYMKLNDMHLEQEKDLDPSELQQWLKSHEAAKQALTKIGEFEHHYDYWNSHNSELQYLKANQNMPQETESVEESIDFKKEAAKHMKDLHSKDSTPANKEYAQKMLRRALEASKMKDPVAAKKHYTGVSEEVELDEMWRVEKSEATGRHHVVKGYNEKRNVWKNKIGAVDFNSEADAKKKAEELNSVKEEANTKTANPYHAGYSAHGQKKTRQHNPYKEGSEGAAMWAKGWEHASDGKPKAKFTNEQVESIEEAINDIDRVAKGKPTSDDVRRKYYSKMVTSILGGKDSVKQQTKSLDRYNKVKSITDPEQKTEQVEENFGADFLAMAKERNPNARLVTPEQKKKEAEELAKKRAELKPAHATPTGNPRPLGGYDPKSGRSYSESTEPKKELTVKTSDDTHDVVNSAGKVVKQFHKTTKGLEYAHQFVKQNKGVKELDEATWAGHSDTVKNPNFNDELSIRRVSPPGKRLKSGKLDYNERSSQERLKALIKFKKAKGGLTGPMGKLPEEVETIEEGPYSSGQLKPSKGMEDQEKKAVTSRTSTIRGRDSKGVYTATMKDGKEVSKVYEENINELSKTTLGSYIKKRSHDVATMGAVTRKYAMDSDAKKKEHGAYTNAARELDQKSNRAFMKGWKHRENIGKAVDRLTKEEVELDEKTLTTAELKKREEIAKAMERKNPNMDKSRKMAIATAVAKRVAEQHDDAE